MAKVTDLLSYKERELLVRWYGTDQYKAAVKLANIIREELAKDHLEVQDIKLIRYLSGQAKGVERYFDTVRQLYKEDDKQEKKS